MKQEMFSGRLAISPAEPVLAVVHTVAKRCLLRRRIRRKPAALMLASAQTRIRKMEQELGKGIWPVIAGSVWKRPDQSQELASPVNAGSMLMMR